MEAKLTSQTFAFLAVGSSGILDFQEKGGLAKSLQL